MLTVVGTILEHSTTHKSFLVSKRATWADPFMPDLITRIQNAFTNVLGFDNAQQMREATIAVYGIQENALRDLAEFKIQIMEDFKTNKIRRDEILNRLGFTAHLKAAQKNDQEALIQLLYAFKQNMTTTLSNEITAAGTATAQITTITNYADVLKNSDVTQETMKGSKKVVTQSGIKELNEIYNKVISVAKISAKFFKEDVAVKEKFSFSKTLNNMNKAPKIVTPPSPLNPAP
jgi:hypothetical protein